MVLLYSFSVGSSATAKAAGTVGNGRENRVYRVGKSGEKLEAGRVRGEQGFVRKRIELVLVLLMVSEFVVAVRCW
jgi:hypothetical protein